MRQRKIIPGVDAKLLIKDAAKLMPDRTRRGFLRGAASLGALAFLTGCDIIDGDTAEGVLRKISAFNDGAQAVLFSRTKLAPEFPESALTRPFPFNAIESLACPYNRSDRGDQPANLSTRPQSERAAKHQH